MILNKGSWDIERTDVNTSEAYKNFCLQAATDGEIFKVFKADPIYKGIVGCDSHGRKTAEMFLNYILSTYPDLQKSFYKFSIADTLGSPLTFKFKEGEFSPNLLRYIKVVGDINKFFGSLNNKTIVEIGDGYGGQAAALNVLNNFSAYTHIDCEQPLMLTKAYLNKLKIKGKLNFYSPDTIIIKKYDLCISDSALSEMDEEGFDYYLKTVLSKSKAAYCTMNDYHRKSTTLKKFQQIYKSVNVYPDKPALDTNNRCYILVCHD